MAKTTTSTAKTAKSTKQEKTETQAANPHADKAGRIPFPALAVDEDGNPSSRLEEVPTDFDPKAHQALKRAHFKEEWMYFEFKAQQLEGKVKELRDQAAESKALGNSEDRAKKKKALAMMKRLEALKAELTADGVDVDELLAAAAE